MGNIQAVIDLPEQLYLSLSGFGLIKERIANESRKLQALKYFKEKVFSLGRAAELSGLSKWDFIEYLSNNDVPVVDYDTTPLLARMFEEKESILDIIFRPNCQK